MIEPHYGELGEGFDRAQRTGLTASPLVGAASHPVTGWTLAAVVPSVTHFSPPHEAALQNAWIHSVERALLFGSGLLLWWPLVASDPVRRRPHPATRILSLLLAMPVQSFLALSIFSSPRPLYEAYASLPAPFGTTALSDQRLAASIMWVFGNLFLVSATLLVAASWRRSERERVPRAERPVPTPSEP
jgi:cytochrome c oxidase assembly factor CtaG